MQFPIVPDNTWEQFPMSESATQPMTEPARVGLRDIIAALRRYVISLIAWLVICLGFAVAYIINTPPEYIASTMVILEPKRPFSSTQSGDAGFIQINLDNSQVESQIQIVKSEQVLRFVFNELNLQGDPEFAANQPGFAGAVLAYFRSQANLNAKPEAGAGKSGLAEWLPAFLLPDQADPVDERREARGFAAFTDHVAVKRIGQSLVLEISFRSKTPARAASIANSVTAAFIRDQIETRMLSARLNGEWLKGRIDEITAQENASVDAVRNGVVPVIALPASDARIISSATVPLAKTYPQTALILIFAIAFALLSGLAAVSVRHSLDRKIRTKRQIQKLLGVDSVVVVPNAREGRDSRQYAKFLSLSVSGRGARSLFSESLRSLRAAIIATVTGKPHRHRLLPSQRRKERHRRQSGAYFRGVRPPDDSRRRRHAQFRSDQQLRTECAGHAILPRAAQDSVQRHFAGRAHRQPGFSARGRR
jgi:capsular polysaccharide biosynthesis protein